jgi:hypothetical protein
MSYLYTDLQTAFKDAIHGKSTAVIDLRAFLNRAVRKANGLVDFASTIRTTPISPGIYNQVYSYAAPADLKEDAIIDIKRQANRYEEFDGTTPEQFDRTKTFDKSRLAVVEEDGVKYLNIATELDSDELVLHQCDSITGNGTWVAADDASNLSVDEYDYINSTGSLKYDLATGDTLATLTLSGMSAVDMTDYENREIFVWQYIPAITDLTSFTIRWGTDGSNYWESTATTTHEGLAFKIGWNLLKFTWPTSDTGSPNIASVVYFQLRINKDAGMAAANNWRTDFIVARAGIIHDVRYYSEYFWKSAAGAYKANSTADTDILVAGDDEFELIVQCATDLAGASTRLEVLERQENRKDFQDSLEKYKISKPSERKWITNSYYDYESVSGPSSRRDRAPRTAPIAPRQDTWDSGVWDS